MAHTLMQRELVINLTSADYDAVSPYRAARIDVMEKR